MPDYLEIARRALERFRHDVGAEPIAAALPILPEGERRAELVSNRLTASDEGGRDQVAAAVAAPISHTSLEDVLKGVTVELWSDAAGRLFLVADEDDAPMAIRRCGARRGEVYTAAEARRIIAIGDPDIVREIHEWKRQFDGIIRDVQTDGTDSASQFGSTQPSRALRTGSGPHR